MRSDIVTQGQSCSIHGCQQVTITHKGGGDIAFTTQLLNDREIQVDTQIQNKTVSVSAERINTDMQATIRHKDFNGVQSNISLICETSQGTWEYLLVDEGTIMLIDGQEVLVKRGT